MPRKKRTALTVNARQLLRLIHVGQSHNTLESQAAADSLRSLLALNLKNEEVQVPAEMVRHLNTLTELEK